jgi:hypothetical protein
MNNWNCYEVMVKVVMVKVVMVKVMMVVFR